MWNGISKDRISCTKSQEKTETGVFKRNESKKLRKNWSKGELNWLWRKKSGEQISDPFVCNMFSVMDFSSFSIHLLHIILIIYFSYVKYNHIWLLIIENFFFPFTNSALVTAISAPSQAQSYSLPITESFCSFQTKKSQPGILFPMKQALQKAQTLSTQCSLTKT